MIVRIKNPSNIENIPSSINDITTQSYDNYMNKKVTSDFMLISYGIVLIVLSLVSLLVLLFSSKDRLAFFGLFLLCSGSGLYFLSGTFISDYFGDPTNWYYATYFLTLLMPVGIFSYAVQFWDGNFKKITIIQLIVFSLYDVSVVLLDIFSISMILSSINFFYVCFGIATFINMLGLIKAMKYRSDELKFIIGGMIIFGITGIIDIVSMLHKYDDDAIIYPIGLFAFIASIILSIIFKYNNVHKKVIYYSGELEQKNQHLNIAIIEIQKSKDEVTELNKTLEERVEMRTKDLNQALETLKNTQHMLIETEKMAASGQLISGISHNLKTPIMTISLILKNIQDLICEYKNSINDDEVTKEDHHEIAGELLSNVEKISPQLSYMSSIISAVKGQVMESDSKYMDEFTLEELISRINLLMSHQIKIKNYTIEYDVRVNTATIIKGVINQLIQVICNLINNAIESYNDNGGKIELTIEKKNDSIIFIIRDYGHGVPDAIGKQIFNKMVTSKGKDGTGLGLYISYSSIKGYYGGDMWFESENGKGSTFFISLPAPI